MKVFVAGGGGAIGACLLPQLIDAGHEVAATARSPQDLVAIEAMGAKGVVMDGLDEHSVDEAMDLTRPEVVVHEMTALRGSSDLRHFDRWFELTNRLRTIGTDNLLSAAQRTGAGGSSPRATPAGPTSAPAARSRPRRTRSTPSPRPKCVRRCGRSAISSAPSSTRSA